MNSFNHYAYGAVGAWMYAVVGGIDLDPRQPGYKNIIMHPQPGGNLTSARTELRSMYGLIKSEWALNQHTFDWRITVPANSTATVYVPAKDASQVTENGHVIETAQGITFLRTENGFAVFEVEAGSYSLSSELDKPA